jgi:hypothetical protein
VDIGLSGISSMSTTRQAMNGFKWEKASMKKAAKRVLLAIDRMTALSGWALTLMLMLSSCVLAHAQTLPAQSSTSPTQISGAPSTQSNDYSAMKAWPTSAHELLSNLKLALDRDWLMQPAFYEEQNLRDFFGTKEKIWDLRFSPGFPQFGINSAVYPMNPGKITEERIKELSYFNRTDCEVKGGIGQSQQQKRNGNISFYFREMSIPFSEAERIFGSNFRFNPPPYPPLGHQILPLITHPLGLKYMVFDFSTGDRRKTIQIITHGNGAINNFYIQTGEK